MPLPVGSLQPENFLLVARSAPTTVKMIDFGFAKQQRLQTPLFSHMYAGELCMCILTLAPEVLNARSGRGSYDKACDMWSLGVILFIMCVLPSIC
jgi:serine/threonine protein kinase